MDISVLTELFLHYTGQRSTSVLPLPPAGSPRRYFRLQNDTFSAIGVYNDDLKENEAFLAFTRHFMEKGLHVPELYEVSDDHHYYLITDLGDTMLKTLIDQKGTGSFPDDVLPWYRKAIRELVRFQVEGHQGLDYAPCIPRDRFDRQSVRWDLSYFKYYFLKLSGITFDEQKLEDDFQHFADLLAEAENEFFMFRDFQSRNIMIFRDECYFIDYQGGRRGALQYDIASLLFEAKTNLPFTLREHLLDHYLVELSHHKNVDREAFLKFYYPFVLIRVLQNLGAYGLRGWIEKKVLFLQSLSFAVKNLKWLNDNDKLPSELPELRRVISRIASTGKFMQALPETKDKLTVRIVSFSYRKPIPDDLTGNGGGFVFDCRAIHNPGRYDEYKKLTGLDEAVQKFFTDRSEMNEFLSDVFSITDRAVRSYIARDYRHLQVAFGCTGGWHRSVYAAERLAEHLKQNDRVIVELEHTELPRQ